LVSERALSLGLLCPGLICPSKVERKSVSGTSITGGALVLKTTMVMKARISRMPAWRKALITQGIRADMTPISASCPCSASTCSSGWPCGSGCVCAVPGGT